MNNIIKGHQYEEFINNYLNSLNNIKNSYLWKDVSEYVLFDYKFINSYTLHRLNIKNGCNPLQDIGTDILYITNDDECIIVQCKNYTNSIKIEDLAGFYYIMNQHNNKTGEVYYTSRLSKQIYPSEKIKYIKKSFLKEKQTNFKLYDYQENVIKLADEYYNNNLSGIISMLCRTGKSLISCYIGMKYKKI